MFDLESLKKEYEETIKELKNPEIISDWEKFQELSENKKHLEVILNKVKEIEEIENRIKENQSLIASKEDAEITILAEEESKELLERQNQLKEQLEKLVNKESEDSKDPKEGKVSAIIMEIRSGTGGEEASLFAGDLYRMYSRYAQIQGFKQKVLDSSPTSVGGIKEITFELNGNDIFSKLKNEIGVHRVQRIPTTEKMGRIHTSTATVAVLPKPKKTEIKIRPDELKIDLYRSSGPGGQNVNKRETAVRITHMPTGIVVASQTERNQLKNRENAMSIIEAKILEKRQIEQEESIAGKRKTQVGSAKRSDKIRTYNFPQDRLTDHRIKKSWHNLEKILAGNLDLIIKDLQKVEN